MHKYIKADLNFEKAKSKENLENLVVASLENGSLNSAEGREILRRIKKGGNTINEETRDELLIVAKRLGWTGLVKLIESKNSKLITKKEEITIISTDLNLGIFGKQVLEKKGDSIIKKIKEMLNSTIEFKKQSEIELKKGGLIEYNFGESKYTLQNSIEKQIVTIIGALKTLNLFISKNQNKIDTKKYGNEYNQLLDKLFLLNGGKQIEGISLYEATLNTGKETLINIGNYCIGILKGSLSGFIRMLDPRTYYMILKMTGKLIGNTMGIVYEMSNGTMTTDELNKQAQELTLKIGDEIIKKKDEFLSASPEKMSEMIGILVGEVVGTIYGGKVAGKLVTSLKKSSEAIVTSKKGEKITTGNHNNAIYEEHESFRVKSFGGEFDDDLF